MKYYYEANFQNRRRLEENKGTAWDTEEPEDSDEQLASWQTDGSGVHSVEA